MYGCIVIIIFQLSYVIITLLGFTAVYQMREGILLAVSLLVVSWLVVSCNIW